MKIKYPLVLLVWLGFVANANAQFGEKLLGKLGVTKAETKPSYTFTGNVVQQLTSTSNKGKQTILETKTYYSANDNVFGTKIISASDPDMKKALEMVDLTLLDLEQSKAYSFMNNNGNKMVVAVGFGDDKNGAKAEADVSKLTVTKTDQTKSIMGFECEGYSMRFDKEKTDMIIWVSKKPIPELTELNKNLAKIAKAALKGDKSNTFAYNSHPELLKLAKDGRATLGFSSVSENGDKSEMITREINGTEDFTFNASQYKSPF